MIQVTTTPDLTPKEIPFPKLMWYPEKELIVLFSKPSTGMVIERGKTPWKNAHYSEYWDDPLFVPYTGTVTLRNA